MNVRHAVIAAALGYSVAAPAISAAQGLESKPGSDSTRRWSLLIPSGTMIPTGEQSHAIKRGNANAIQISYSLNPVVAITSTLNWARSRDAATADAPKLDVFMYDVGAELRAPQWMESDAMSLTPFAGAGAGGRSYNYRKLDVDATHNLAAYVSAGGEARIRRVGVRLEARDYVTGFKPLNGAGEARTANDVVLMAGLRLFSR